MPLTAHVFRMQGLTLLTLGANDMVGEHAMGFKEPEVIVEEDPAEASRKFVDRRIKERQLQQRAASADSPGRRPPRAKPAAPKKVRLAFTMRIRLLFVWMLVCPSFVILDTYFSSRCHIAWR